MTSGKYKKLAKAESDR